MGWGSIFKTVAKVSNPATYFAAKEANILRKQGLGFGALKAALSPRFSLVKTNDEFTREDYEQGQEDYRTGVHKTPLSRQHSQFSRAMKMGQPGQELAANELIRRSIQNKKGEGKSIDSVTMDLMGNVYDEAAQKANVDKITSPILQNIQREKGLSSKDAYAKNVSKNRLVGQSSLSSLVPKKKKENEANAASLI